jgi:hypothetical protein
VRPILFDLSKSYFSSSKDERERKNYDQQPTLRQAVPFVLDQGTMDAAFELNDSLNPDLILSPYDAIFLEHGEGKDFRVGLLCGPAFGDFLFTNYSPRDHLRIDPWFQHKGEACPMPYTLFLGRDETPCYIEVNADEAIRQGFKVQERLQQVQCWEGPETIGHPRVDQEAQGVGLWGGVCQNHPLDQQDWRRGKRGCLRSKVQ